LISHKFTISVYINIPTLPAQNVIEQYFVSKWEISGAKLKNKNEFHGGVILSVKGFFSRTKSYKQLLISVLHKTGLSRTRTREHEKLGKLVS